MNEEQRSTEAEPLSELVDKAIDNVDEYSLTGKQSYADSVVGLKEKFPKGYDNAKPVFISERDVFGAKK